MQRSTEDQVCREWIQVQVRLPGAYGKPQVIERSMPLRWCPVIVGQGDVVTRVCHPVHEPQRRVSKCSLEHVIFDKNEPSSDTNCLPKQDHGLDSVMEQIK